MCGSPRIAATTPAAPPPMATEAISSSSLWSDDLPPELAGLVLCRLPSFADRVRFGAVCRRWTLAAQRQAPTLPPALPWICPFPRQVFQSFPDGESHNLGSSQPTPSLLCCGLSENWLLFMNSGSGRGIQVQQASRFLKNPLNGATIPLPDKFGSRYDFRFDLISIRKFIVVSSDADGLIVAMTRRGLTGLTPSHGRGGQHTACCRPGMSFWSIAANPGYEDIAFHHGIIYGVTRIGSLYAHNISEDCGTGEPVVSKAKQVIMSSDTSWFDLTIKQLFLVVSRGNLLLVKWNDTKSSYGRSSGASVFEVFKADLEMSRWSDVPSLGDQVLFVSERCSKAVAASNHSNYLCGNHIYFMDYETCSSSNMHHRPGATICGTYDLRNNICHQILTLQCSRFAPAWFFPHK